MKKIYFLLIAILFSGVAFSAGHTVSITVVKHVTCSGGNDGRAYATVSGGVGPFSYSWNSTPVQTTDTLTNVVTGIYTVTVTDLSDNSTATDLITIGPGQAMGNTTISGQLQSCLGGSFFLTANNPNATNYAWTGPAGYTATGQSVTPMAFNVGNYFYHCYAISAIGCTKHDSIQVNIQPPPNISFSVQNPTCAGASNGSILTSVFGGTGGPYSYNWSNGSTTSNLTNVVAGFYTLQVFDAMGCNVSQGVNVTEPSPLVASTTVTPPTTCNACDGSVAANVVGGTPPYNYLWSNAVTAATASNLCPGLYSITAMDGNGCSTTAAVTLSSSSNLSVNITSTPDSCGLGVGTASAVVSASQGPISYSWQPNNATTASLFNLNAGVYQVTVSDTVCSFTASVTIPNLSSPTGIATSNAATCNTANGLMVVTATGGQAPYTYSVDGAPFSANTTYGNLLAGIHTIIVKDVNGCQSTFAHVIQQTGLSLYFTTSNAYCGGSNGTSTAVPVGGTSPYSYLWSNGQSTQTISNLAPGTYTCTITDNTGCSATAVTTVGTQATGYQNWCNAQYNCGNNILDATASYGAGPYTYSWQPGGQTTAIITNQNPGTYICTVTDANGCTSYGYHYIYNNNYAIVTGTLYADNNSNCLLDGGDTTSGTFYINATNALGQQVGWAYVAGNGTYTMYLPNVIGTYTLTPTNPYWYTGQNITFTCSNNVININTTCDTLLNLDLGYTPIVGQDLHVGLYCGTARPGFIRSSSIYYYNPGTVAVNGILKMKIDPLLTFSGSTPAPTTITGNLIEWNLGLLPHAANGVITVGENVPTIQNGGFLGALLHDSVWIEPIVGDNYILDNSSNCVSTITGSYDPNIKSVTSSGMDAFGNIGPVAQDLYYTVEFQNTGTDTAFTVVVRDTISNLLDLTTFELIATSHPNYTVNITPARALEVKFNNILLVDSFHNEPLSHGFIHYKIRTISNIANGDVINNTAGIYFDFNSPVITNTTVTHVFTNVGVSELANGMNMKVFPNPTNASTIKLQLNASLYKNLRFVIYTSNGEKVMDKALQAQTTHEINIKDLNAGMYFYEVTNDEGKRSVGKLVITE